MKKSPIPQSRRHVMVFDEDWDWLNQEYGAGSKNNVGVGVAIRTIVHAKVIDMKAKANDAFDRIRSQGHAGSETFISTKTAVAGDPVDDK